MLLKPYNPPHILKVLSKNSYISAQYSQFFFWRYFPKQPVAKRIIDD
ncbi:hypothetical protein GXM_06307 [Nostoc sphaeroides CCNUC1]|uniref:Uncharacterized protein n=1 Tax=Nostoc sphaeroides CCNUC1 TaxID=2653204 RepID=A0A5P8W7Q7_9NOSO|nr:hypothetical protein GXM_06307 [Nostoc sphaeroides CCNUC1]